MGDDEGADRNAANRARFEKLPPAGSPEYWAALEDAAEATRLDLEILAMCARERLAAGRPDHVERVYEMILKKIDKTLKGWVNHLIPQGARDRAAVIEDIMQECAIDLWQELSGEGDTFLTQGFWIKMWRMTSNNATQKRIEEGLSKRKGTEDSTRAPQYNIDSLNKPMGPDDERTIGETLTDHHAEDDFSLIELVNDVRNVWGQLTSDERLLLGIEIADELKQAETAKRLGISDRSVRNRLKALHAKMRALLDPPDTSGGDGGAAGGEEEPR